MIGNYDSFVQPPPTARVITGGLAASESPSLLDPKLLDALPVARRVLELGTVSSQLGRAFCSQHPIEPRDSR